MEEKESSYLIYLLVCSEEQFEIRIQSCLPIVLVQVRSFRAYQDHATAGIALNPL